jgi:hypothetical protein
VGERVDHLELGHGGEADRGAHVVAEHEERAADGEDAAVGGHAVEDAAHAVLAHPEVHLAAARFVGRAHAGVLDGRTGVAREVGAAAHEARHDVDQGLQARTAGLAGGDLGADLEARQRVLPSGQALGGDAGLVGGPVAVPGGEALVPRLPRVAAPASGGPVHLEHVVGDPERLRGRQAQDLLGGRHLVLAERVPVGVGGVGEVGGRPADVAAQHQQRRRLVVVARGAQRGLERVGVVGGLTELGHVPAVALEPADDVVGVGERGVAVDADVVVVVDVHQPAELQVPGERRRFVADALHQVAVAADHVGAVVAQVGAEAGPQPALGDAEPDCVGEPLAQRPGGHLDAGGVVHLRVAGGGRAPLAEVPDVVEREPIPREVQHRVQEDRRVAGREHEAVAVGPVGRAGVVLHDPRPEDVGQRGQRHGRAGVPVAGGLGAVHGQAADHVDGTLLERAVGGCAGVGIGVHACSTLVPAPQSPTQASAAARPAAGATSVRRGRAPRWR